MPDAHVVCASSGGAVHPVPATVAAGTRGVAADHVAGVDNPPTGDAEPMLASTGAAPTPAVLTGAAALTRAPPPAAPPTLPATLPEAAASRVWLYKMLDTMVLNTFQDTTSKPALPTLDTTGSPSTLSRALAPGGAAGAAGAANDCTALGTLETTPRSPLVCAAVAVGWSAYAAGVIHSLHLGIPDALLAGPQAGGVLNLPAVLISLLVAGLLALGTRESATVNFLLVVIKLVALGAYVTVKMSLQNSLDSSLLDRAHQAAESAPDDVLQSQPVPSYAAGVADVASVADPAPASAGSAGNHKRDLAADGT